MQDYDDAHTQIVTRAGGVAQTAYGIGTAVGGGVTSQYGACNFVGLGCCWFIWTRPYSCWSKTIWTGKSKSNSWGEILFPRPSVWNKAQESFCMDLLILIL